MEKRMIDVVEMKYYFLFWCISKEIFGIENNVNILIKEMCNELNSNFNLYKFICEYMKRLFDNLEENLIDFFMFLREKIEDDFFCGDLILWFVSIFF